MITSEDFFEELKIHLETQLPFVAYKTPSATSPVIKAFFQKDARLHHIKDFSESGFVFAPFDDNKKAILIPAEQSRILQTTAEANEFTKEIGTKMDSEEEKNAKKQHYNLVSKALDEIKGGTFKKVVLSRKEIVDFEAPDAIKIFRDLLRKYPTAFVYVWFHPEVGLWLGASPETLLKIERGKFKTMALAGTQKFDENVEVTWGEKEREEQQIVVDSILENLQNTSVKNIKVSKASTVRAGTLLHLRSDISGEVLQEHIGLKQLISVIHPTPAVCGLPKESAKEFILEYENYNREFYTGFLGELNLKTERKRNTNRRNQENQAYGSVSISTALYVNLRCMKFEGNKAVIFVGGGITKDSDPEAEWEETLNKAETMKAVLF